MAIIPPPSVRAPVKFPVPLTSNKVDGALVPIPTLPALVIVILLELLVLKPIAVASALFKIRSFCALTPMVDPLVDALIVNFITDATPVPVLFSVRIGDVEFDIVQAPPELENPLERVSTSETVNVPETIPPVSGRGAVSSLVLNVSSV